MIIFFVGAINVDGSSYLIFDNFTIATTGFLDTTRADVNYIVSDGVSNTLIWGASIQFYNGGDLNWVKAALAGDANSVITLLNDVPSNKTTNGQAIAINPTSDTVAYISLGTYDLAKAKSTGGFTIRLYSISNKITLDFYTNNYPNASLLFVHIIDASTLIVAYTNTSQTSYYNGYELLYGSNTPSGTITSTSTIPTSQTSTTQTNTSPTTTTTSTSSTKQSTTSSTSSSSTSSSTSSSSTSSSGGSSSSTSSSSGSSSSTSKTNSSSQLFIISLLLLFVVLM